MMTAGKENSKAELRWDVRQRQEFVEEMLFWNGRINRADLTVHFGISGVQATNDLSRYAKFAPDNMAYDTAEKTYLATPEFQPLLIQPEPDMFLRHLAARDLTIFGKIPPAEILPLLQRAIDPFILRRIVLALRNQSAVEIQYQSMSQSDSTWRWIAPHAFASDGMRWHVRAFCFTDHIFKDFLLARILSVEKERQGIVSQEEDIEWSRLIKVYITPHPGLSLGQQKVIEWDFGMQDGAVEVEVRQALLLYFLKRLNLIREDPRPEVQQIVLRNREEVLTLLGVV